MPKLVVISEELAGKTYDLTHDTTTIGRGPENTIRIDDSTISHHHGSISLEGGLVVLRDLNSTNGTRVNGQKIMEAKLANGDVVRFGRVELRFEGESKKTTVPLPKATSGINVEEIGSARTQPSQSFASTSPFPKQKQQRRGALQWIILVLTLVAAVLLGWLIVRVTGS